MIISCQDANITIHSINKSLTVELHYPNYYDFYMNNNTNLILDQIPIDELETYINYRRKQEKDEC